MSHATTRLLLAAGLTLVAATARADVGRPRVILPPATTLTINGVPSDGTSNERVVTSQDLTPDMNYYYELVATTMVNGTPATERKVVSVEAGYETKVTFHAPTPYTGQQQGVIPALTTYPAQPTYTPPQPLSTYQPQPSYAPQQPLNYVTPQPSYPPQQLLNYPQQPNFVPQQTFRPNYIPGPSGVTNNSLLGSGMPGGGGYSPGGGFVNNSLQGGGVAPTYQQYSPPGGVANNSLQGGGTPVPYRGPQGEMNNNSFRPGQVFDFRNPNTGQSLFQVRPNGNSSFGVTIPALGGRPQPRR